MPRNHETIFQEGSAAWCIKRYKEVTLLRLLTDLSALEKRGLETSECDKIKDALNRACAIITAVPNDSIFRSQIWTELTELRDLYENWNGVPNDKSETFSLRRSHHERLLNHRQKMWRKFLRKNRSHSGDLQEQPDMYEDVDRKLLDEMHLSFKAAVDAHPELFPLLKIEIEYYETTVAKHD